MRSVNRCSRWCFADERATGSYELTDVSSVALVSVSVLRGLCSAGWMVTLVICETLEVVKPCVGVSGGGGSVGGCVHCGGVNTVASSAGCDCAGGGVNVGASGAVGCVPPSCQLRWPVVSP